MSNKTYYILSNDDEILLNNYLNALSKEANNLKNVNYLYALRAICNVLRESQNLLKDLEDIKNLYDFITVTDPANPHYLSEENGFSAELINAVNDLKVHTTDVYWDKEYTFNTLNDFVNKVKAALTGTVTEEVKQEILDADTNVLNTIDKIIADNDEVYARIADAKDKINNQLNSDSKLYDKYNSKYQDLTEKVNKLSDPKNLYKLENDVINALSGKDIKTGGEEQSEEEDIFDENTYVVIVGSKETVEQHINKLVKNINQLYKDVIDTTVIDAQQLYSQAMINFMNTYDGSQNKDELLNSCVEAMINNDQVSDAVKELVRSYVAATSDQLYSYTDTDKSELTAIFNSINNTLDMIYSNNEALMDEINEKKTALTEFENQYAEEHDGESYNHQPVNENITNQGNISNRPIENMNKIYSKEVPHISRINLSATLVNLSVDNEYTIDVTYVPEVHKPFEQETLNITTSNNNVIEILENTLDHIKFKAVNSGSVHMTVLIDGKSASVTVNASSVQVIDYLFYFGHDGGVLTGDHKINTGFNKFKHISSINDILGKYYTGDEDKVFYLVMPYEYYVSTKVTNVHNTEIHFDQEGLRYENEVDGTTYVILIYPDYGYVGDAYLIRNNHTPVLYKNVEKEFDIISGDTPQPEAPDTIEVDGITYYKEQPNQPGNNYELHTYHSDEWGIDYYAWIEVDEPQEGKRFYFGNNVNVLTESLDDLNADFDSFVTIESLDDILGEYDTTTPNNKDLYLVVPSEYRGQFDILSAQGQKMDITPIDNNDGFLIYTQERYSAQLVYLVRAGEGKSNYENIDKDFDYVEIYIPVEGVTLDRTEITVVKGTIANDSLIATINPQNATNKNVTWTSSNNSVVVVNSGTIIFRNTIGEADVTVTTEDGGYTATCHISIVPEGGGEEENTYYYYAGWTLPTADNVETIVTETYQDTKNSSTYNTAGKKTTSKSTIDYTSNTLYKSGGSIDELYYYVLVPADHAIYDIINTNVSDTAFTLQETFTVGNQNHKIYKSVETSRYINAIIIK